MRTRRLAVVAVLGTALALLFGIAYGAIGTGGTISACYKKANGSLRVIDTDAGQHCRASEKPIAWNAQGPKGEKGEKGEPGEKGEKGAPGEKGEPGPVAATYTRGKWFQVDAGAYFNQSLICLPPDVAVGGGYALDPDYADVIREGPSGVDLNLNAGFEGMTQTLGAPTGWHLYGKNRSSGEITVQLWAVCQDVP